MIKFLNSKLLNVKINYTNNDFNKNLAFKFLKIIFNE